MRRPHRYSRSVCEARQNDSLLSLRHSAPAQSVLGVRVSPSSPLPPLSAEMLTPPAPCVSPAGRAAKIEVAVVWNGNDLFHRFSAGSYNISRTAWCGMGQREKATFYQRRVNRACVQSRRHAGWGKPGSLARLDKELRDVLNAIDHHGPLLRRQAQNQPNTGSKTPPSAGRRTLCDMSCSTGSRAARLLRRCAGDDGDEREREQPRGDPPYELNARAGHVMMISQCLSYGI